MERVDSTLHISSEQSVSSITTADAHTSAASSRLSWRPPADLNGLVRFAERRNLASGRVPSRFNWPLPSALVPGEPPATSFYSARCDETLTKTYGSTRCPNTRDTSLIVKNTGKLKSGRKITSQVI